MNKPPLPFSAEEFEDRLFGLREAMEVHGLEACVLTSPWNVAYYTGLTAAALAPEAGVVVTTGDIALLVPDRAAARADARGHGRLVVHDGARDDFWRAVAAVAGTGRAVGCEADHLTLMQSEKLNAFLKPRRGVDIARAAMEQRMVKSEAELAWLRWTAGVAAQGLQAMRPLVVPGAAEMEIAMAGRAAMEAARTLPDGEMEGVQALVQSGPNSADAAQPPSRRLLKPGEPVGLTAAPVLNGVSVALKETVLVGPPSEAALSVLSALDRLRDSFPALARAGTSCGEIAVALGDVLGGLAAPGGWRAGFGGGLPGEPLLALRPGNDTVLEPGMILALAPHVGPAGGWTGAGGYGFQTLFEVTDSGAVPLTDPLDMA